MKKLILLLAVVSIMGCKKEGPVGPQGEQGDKGETGQVGPAGQDGTGGGGGTSSVKSFTVTAKPSDWAEAGVPGEAGYGYAIQINSLSITQDVVDNGMLMVYFGGKPEWHALPFTISFDTWESHWEYSYDAGSVVVATYDSDLLTLKPTIDMKFKVVVIGGSEMKKEGVDHTNYQQVKEAYNLN